jgi:hypothetical protein
MYVQPKSNRALERLGFGLLTLAVLVAEKKPDRNHIPLQKNISMWMES